MFYKRIIVFYSNIPAFSCFIYQKITLSIHFLDDVHTNADGFFVHRNQVVMTLGQCFAERFHYTFYRHDGANLKQSTQYTHVECLCHLAFVGFIHRINAVHVNVFTCGRFNDTISVVYQHSARLYLIFELGQ